MEAGRKTENRVGWVGSHIIRFHQRWQKISPNDTLHWPNSICGKWLKIPLWCWTSNFKQLPRFQTILKDYKNSVFNISLHRWEKVIDQESDYQNSTTFKSVPASVFVIIWRRASSNWVPLMLNCQTEHKMLRPQKVSDNSTDMLSTSKLSGALNSSVLGVSGKQAGQKDFWGFPTQVSQYLVCP